jgi:CRP/FNR family transcriptional regulator, cyclic AMP receptor protein
MPMPLIPSDFQRKLATFPLATYQAGETVLSAATKTGRLLILKEGAVAVLKEGVEIARVTEPGAVFGELSVLLDQPHSAEVRALEASQFHVADGATTLRTDPIALLYVATVLAQRLDSANRALLDLKRQVNAGEPRSVVGRTVEKIEGLLGASGAILSMPAILMTRLPPSDPWEPLSPGDQARALIGATRLRCPGSAGLAGAFSLRLAVPSPGSATGEGSGAGSTQDNEKAGEMGGRQMVSNLSIVVV